MVFDALPFLLSYAERSVFVPTAEMLRDPNFRRPHDWDTVNADACDGILLPGGAGAGLLDYVHSPVLQHKVRS